ncbi:dipeptidase PepV [Hathewaya limosa]|uniref:Succinyl-diaminopimelate desuccinylase n=1 Tax=Hathewaya limosa TaxID=1536 RepID=A0ABU0JV32_HATLI|nr:dipeptidase PepV [Hathewaya limosa]MDQ0479978.1 succinyl-diaminopimelate desuccinylase [Hathewaya limosa]
MELNKKIDEMREQIIQTTQESIRIKSVADESQAKDGMPFGEGPVKALEHVLEVSKKLGFKTVNVDNYVGYAEFGTGEEYITALGHVDVVPEGDGWIHPPYAAEIHDGKLYGRGALDDKGPIIATLYGAKAIMDLGLPISKRIRIIFGTSEEIGSDELERYLKKEKPPVLGFTPDAEYPIINGEKGIVDLDLVKCFKEKQNGDVILKHIKGGQAGNVVADYCEALIETNNQQEITDKLEKFIKETSYELSLEKKENGILVKAKGMGAHGSTPWLGKNAIMHLIKFLAEIEFSSKEINQYIAFLNNNIGTETSGESFGIYLEDKVSGKLAFNVGVIKMTEERADLTLNIRHPVTNKLDDMMDPFKKKIEGTDFTIENFAYQAPLYFEESHPLVKALQKVYTEQTGKEATLLSIGGGTYAKEIPNTLAFGPIFPGGESTIHQANEYIRVDNLILNAKIYAHALYELAK